MVAIESKDDLYVINLLEDFDEFYLELEKYAEENRVPIIDKIGIRFLIQMLKVKKAKNLLEIGTAIGYTSIKLAEKIGCNVTTIERDDKMYNQAKNNIEERNLTNKITLLHADALELQGEVVTNAPYDVVFIDGAIRHSRDLKQLSRKINNYNEWLLKHENYESVILPFGDGITITTRK